MFCSRKYNLNWGLYQLREVWTKNFKTSVTEEDDVEMTGDGEGSGKTSRDEDDIEKQMCLANESDKTAVRNPPSRTQVDQLEGCLWEKPIPYISNNNFSQAKDHGQDTGKHVGGRNEYQITDS